MTLCWGFCELNKHGQIATDAEIVGCTNAGPKKDSKRGSLIQPTQTNQSTTTKEGQRVTLCFCASTSSSPKMTPKRACFWSAAAAAVWRDVSRPAGSSSRCVWHWRRVLLRGIHCQLPKQKSH
ncbi:hypothetical protein, variant [Capsaspora owczarzaki ATCC 30864]|uniref:Uncharacterized protein n=1 Tax=Capsaspora owczarzaki (strain ATCC 30864) TaxID=595528 RepID=A0A0D2VYE2_CAPO3|nr:hypothetical protein CAOG_010045 [Capsaspora owczarzaki ATCC 30864]KJE96737.1 hypothetical protein, variant [Capsaspora owczarzaki ATCC 30864]